MSVISDTIQIERTQSEPPNSPSNRDERDVSQPLSLPTEVADREFNPLEAAKRLLESRDIFFYLLKNESQLTLWSLPDQEATIKANSKPNESPPSVDEDRETEEGDKSSLLITMETAPPG